MSDSLPNIVEDYILEKRNEGSVNRDIYSDRLRALGLRDEEIHNIIIEIDDDCDKELLAGKGIKKAKKDLVMSLFIAIGFATISLATALGFLLHGRIQVFFFGIIGASSIYAIKSYSEIKAVENRKNRRILKWNNF